MRCAHPSRCLTKRRYFAMNTGGRTDYWEGGLGGDKTRISVISAGVLGSGVNEGVVFGGSPSYL